MVEKNGLLLRGMRACRIISLNLTTDIVISKNSGHELEKPQKSSLKFQLFRYTSRKSDSIGLS